MFRSVESVLRVFKIFEAKQHETRQVFDIPALHIEVTEHQTLINVCPCCGAENRGECPSDVRQATQYGLNLKSHAAYFSHYHHIPLKRSADIFEDVFRHRVSEHVILDATREAAEHVTPSNEAVKQRFIGGERFKTLLVFRTRLPSWILEDDGPWCFVRYPSSPL